MQWEFRGGTGGVVKGAGERQGRVAGQHWPGGRRRGLASQLYRFSAVSHRVPEPQFASSVKWTQ